MRRRERLDRELRRREDHQRVGRRALQDGDLRRDVRVGELVRLLRDDARALGLDRVLEARDEVVAQVGVLVDHGDPRVLARLHERPAVDGTFAAIAREEAHRPRVLARLLELGRAVADEELGHLRLVQVGANRDVVVGADRVEDREHPVLLDELARQQNRLRRVVAVVVVAVVDLPPVHPAARVHVREVRLRARADRAEGGGEARERDRPADHDLVRGHARIRRRPRAAGRNGETGERERDREQPRHREIGVRRTERTTRTFPTVICVPSGLPSR